MILPQGAQDAEVPKELPMGDRIMGLLCDVMTVSAHPAIVVRYMGGARPRVE